MCDFNRIDSVFGVGEIPESFSSVKELLECLMAEGNIRQAEAIRAIFETNDNLVISGVPGSGKLTFIRRVASLMENAVVVTYTGTHAVENGGTTFASMFGVKIDKYIPSVRNGILENTSKKSVTSEYLEVVRSMKTLIVDFAQDTSPDMIDYIADVFRRTRESKEPFGGVRIILVGDFCYLPVLFGKNNPSYGYYGDRYFFASKALRATGYKFIHFDKSYTIKDENLLSILNNIRCGSLSSHDVDVLNDRVGRKLSVGNRCIAVFNSEEDADGFNASYIDKIDGKLYSSVIDDTSYVSKHPVYVERFYFKIGQYVIFTDNGVNYRKGDAGVITDVVLNKYGNAEEILVQMDNRSDSSILVSVKKKAWNRYSYFAKDGVIEKKIKGSVFQFPVLHGYAISTYKTRGLSLNCICPFMNSLFRDGLPYASISRAKSLDSLHLINPVNAKMFLMNGQFDQFFKGMLPGINTVLPSYINHVSREDSGAFH